MSRKLHQSPTLQRFSVEGRTLRRVGLAVKVTEGASSTSPQFGNPGKIQKQMQDRGWTNGQIGEAMETPGIPAQGKKGPAMRYVHPISGRSVIVDEATGEIFHVGGDGYLYD